MSEETKQIILNYRTENNRWVLGAEPNQEGVIGGTGEHN